MNKEQQELVDEVYENYLKNRTLLTRPSNIDVQPDYNEPMPKYMFIHGLKTNKEFSEMWELKIEERELSYTERYDIHKEYITGDKLDLLLELATNENLDKLGVPTKLITVTHNDKTIESYE
jgi:hypothetical protein